MGTHFFVAFIAFVLISPHASGSEDDSKNTVVFFDSFKNQFFRDDRMEASQKYDSVSLTEVAAIVNVLTGLPPPSSISVQSSSKLNRILAPNPFDRPCAVFIFEIKETGGLSAFLKSSNLAPNNLFSNRFLLDPAWTRIQLPGENEVQSSFIDDDIDNGFDALCIDDELSHLATALNGSYTGNFQSNGVLMVPAANGMPIRLQFSKNSESRYLLSIVSFIYKMKQTLQMNGDLNGNKHVSTKIIIGCFKGIQALQKEYGNLGSQHMELFFKVVEGLFHLLHEIYQGEVVGLILLNGKGSNYLEGDRIHHFPARISRSLEEDLANATIARAEKLVRRTLAWTAGLIFLVSVFVGVYLLFNMPLTKDTLLYSNVKLD